MAKQPITMEVPEDEAWFLLAVVRPMKQATGFGDFSGKIVNRTIVAAKDERSHKFPGVADTGKS